MQTVVDMWFTRSTPRISVLPYQDNGDKWGDVVLQVTDGASSNSVMFILDRGEVHRTIGSHWAGMENDAITIGGISLWFLKDTMEELLFALEMI